MNTKLVAQNGGERTFVLVLDPGDEASTTISKFAEEKQVGATSSGIRSVCSGRRRSKS